MKLSQHQPLMGPFVTHDYRTPVRSLVAILGATLLIAALVLRGEGTLKPSAPPAVAPANNGDRFGPALQLDPSLGRTQVETRIIRRLNSVLRSCGQLCDTNRPLRPGPFQDRSSTAYFRVSSAPIQCRALYANKDLDAPRETADAPENVPPFLLPFYTLNGQIPILPRYRNQKYLANRVKLQWTDNVVQGMMDQARRKTLRGNYGVGNTNGLQKIFAKVGLRGKRVLVIGSENPWVEACALVAGAGHVTTLEYREIATFDSRISAATPDVFAADFLAGKLEPFDVVVSFSSLEHSGLGRYGDALNPWGDIISVAKAWCVTKPGGYAIIEVPFRPTNEVTFFNIHRTYGRIRMPYMMTNWEEAFPRISSSTYARVYRRLDNPSTAV